jgi:hypothetical protein
MLEILALIVIGAISLFAIIRYAVKYGVEDALIEMEKRKQNLKDNK